MLTHMRKRDVLLVRLTGELDQCSASGIRRDLDALLDDSRVRHLVLDLREMPFMDSSGLGVILGRYRTLQLRGGSVSLMHLSPQVKRVYDLSGMGQIIPVIEEKEGQA
ncbi:MAG: anti-sigma factor antagonist [Clostridia bacterium]|nr:anti-sigma factor antagonist [Clostridia bacterium]